MCFTFWSRHCCSVKPAQASSGSVNTTAGTVFASNCTLCPAITADAPRHWFRMMKELTLLGYFTSEFGYTKAMRYVESPGRYDPCVPYTKGEVSWAPHA